MTQRYQCACCDGQLEYEADLAAPGKGQSWSCTKCGEKHWVHDGVALPFKVVDPECLELTEADVV